MKTDVFFFLILVPPPVFRAIFVFGQTIPQYTFLFFSLDGLYNPTAITGATGDNLDSPMSDIYFCFIFLFHFPPSLYYLRLRFCLTIPALER